MSTRNEKTLEDKEEEELYRALEQVLEEFSPSTRPQRKLADKLLTLVKNHYEAYGNLLNEPSGEVEIKVVENERGD